MVESTIAVLDDRVQTVRQKSDEEFLPACLKKQSNFLPRLWLGGNIGSWTSRLHMTEPNKISRLQVLGRCLLVLRES